MTSLYLIPNADDIVQSMKFAQNGGAFFEYHDFCNPELLDNKDRLRALIDFYRDLPRDRRHDLVQGVYHGISIACADSAIRRVSEIRIRQSMEAAERLGVEGVIFATNCLPGPLTDYYCDDWMYRNASFWRALTAEYPHLRILIENRFDSEHYLFAALGEALKDVPNFGLSLNYAAATLSDEDLAFWLSEAAPYIRHLRICDVAGSIHEPLTLGDGHIDWREFDLLRRQYVPYAGISLGLENVAQQELSLNFMRETQLLDAAFTRRREDILTRELQESGADEPSVFLSTFAPSAKSALGATSAPSAPYTAATPSVSWIPPIPENPLRPVQRKSKMLETVIEIQLSADGRIVPRQTEQPPEPEPDITPQPMPEPEVPPFDTPAETLTEFPPEEPVEIVLPPEEPVELIVPPEEGQEPADEPLPEPPVVEKTDTADREEILTVSWQQPEEFSPQPDNLSPEIIELPAPEEPIVEPIAEEPAPAEEPCISAPPQPADTVGIPKKSSVSPPEKKENPSSRFDNRNSVSLQTVADIAESGYDLSELALNFVDFDDLS